MSVEYVQGLRRSGAAGIHKGNRQSRSQERRLAIQGELEAEMFDDVPDEYIDPTAQDLDELLAELNDRSDDYDLYWAEDYISVDLGDEYPDDVVVEYDRP